MEIDHVTTHRNGAFIHTKAHVEGAHIGARVKVWQFASVLRGAVLGEDCVVGSCSVVDAAHVGDRCKIGHGAQLHPGTRIGNDVFVGPGVIFCNDAWPRVAVDGFDAVGLLSGDVVTTQVMDGATVGAGCVILPGVVIGVGAVVAAGVNLRRSVPNYHLVKASGAIVPLAPRKADRMRRAA